MMVWIYFVYLGSDMKGIMKISAVSSQQSAVSMLLLFKKYKAKIQGGSTIPKVGSPVLVKGF
ncbi:MAG TPA: hypothetical protein ENK91_01985 [Bacteroidetes bacterium]|nr:hypothetical protein [Bacteroidota bacterium]